MSSNSVFVEESRFVPVLQSSAQQPVIEKRDCSSTRLFPQSTAEGAPPGCPVSNRYLYVVICIMSTGQFNLFLSVCSETTQLSAWKITVLTWDDTVGSFPGNNWPTSSAASVRAWYSNHPGTRLWRFSCPT